MGNYCKQCGMCCKCLFISSPMSHIKEEALVGNIEAQFIVDNMEQITDEEAKIINPRIKQWFELETRYRFKIPYFYRCKLLIENKCSKYEERPRMCSAFPFYEQPKINPTMLFYVKDCGFNREELKYTVDIWPDSDQERIKKQIKELDSLC